MAKKRRSKKIIVRVSRMGVGRTGKKILKFTGETLIDEAANYAKKKAMDYLGKGLAMVK